MRKLVALADRTAVLFLGVAAGAAIGFAFGRSGEKAPERPVVRPARIAAARIGAPPAAPADARGFECALPFQQHLLDTVKDGKPVTIGVFGDSFGDGVWSALYRLLPAAEHFRVLKYSQQSTGFTRYASLNLEEHAQAQLAADGPVDVAVISFGANDTQGVYSGGHAAALMSPEWQRVIGERVDRFVALMRAKGAMVYWVGLPKMRKASFDDDIAAMNDFYTARMKALRVPFIDIKPLTVDDAGEFALYMPDPVNHERRLLRANDGIHMSMNGYVVITRALADRIKAYVSAAKVIAGVSEAAPPVTKPIRVAVPDAKKTEPEKRDERPKRHEQPHKREDGERHKRHEGEHKDKASEQQPHREGGDKEPTRPAKHDEADKPTRNHESEKERPAKSEKRDGEAKDRAPRKSSEEARPHGGETKSDEAKANASRSGEAKPASSETRRSEGRDKSGDRKPRETEGKARTTDTRRTETRDKKSGDAPAKPRKHRDEIGNSSEGNSQ